VIGGVSDSSQGGTPPQNPYGGQPSSGEQPYGGQPPANPYGQAPYPQQPPQPQQPQQPAGQPYGQPAYGHPPYGQPQQPQPYGSPYARQPPPGPLGDGLDMYGRPLGNDSRPGTVVAAGWTTLIFSGLTALAFAIATFVLLVSKETVIDEVNKAILEQGGTTDFDAEDAFGFFVVIMFVFTAWCVIACVLAVFAMRRSTGARITLVDSTVIAGLLSLVAIGSLVSAAWLIACVAVVIMLFTGGANDWYAGRRRF
jgi:hypothetical protein